jgi:hypothetical protein
MRIAAVWVVLSVLCFSANAEKHALLVGVSDYKSKYVTDLDGPYFDIKSFETLLPSWGVQKKNIHSLINAQATKSNILMALTRLQSRTKPGDEVFIYFSGHGTSASDRNSNLPLAHTTGAFLPYDADVSNAEEALNSLIVGSRDLKPLLQKLDRDRQVFIVVDACYSENTARSIFSKEKPAARAQTLNFDVFATVTLPQKLKESSSEYPYKNVVFMSASSKSETAGDYKKSMSHLTYDGNPHGVFSDALLRVMNGLIPSDSNQDAKLSYLELYKATSSYLSNEPQSPKLSYLSGSGAINRGVLSTNDPALIQKIKTPFPEQLTRLNIYIENSLSYLESGLVKESERVFVTDKRDADIQLVQKGDLMLALNKSGEKIRSFDRVTNRIISRYLDSQGWLKNIRNLKGRGSFNLAVEMVGKGQGSTVKLGEQFGIEMLTDSRSNLWLFAMDSNGKVTTLFPYEYEEYRQFTAGSTRPFSNLYGKKPLGEDWVIAVAFKSKHKEMEKFIGAEFNASSEKADLLYSTLNLLRNDMAIHEKRLFTVK